MNHYTKTTHGGNGLWGVHCICGWEADGTATEAAAWALGSDHVLYMINVAGDR